MGKKAFIKIQELSNIKINDNYMCKTYLRIYNFNIYVHVNAIDIKTCVKIFNTSNKMCVIEIIAIVMQSHILR